MNGGLARGVISQQISKPRAANQPPNGSPEPLKPENQPQRSSTSSQEGETRLLRRFFRKLIGLMMPQKASKNLLLLQAPIEVIECFLQDLIRCSEGRFMGNRIDRFLLDLHKDPLGF